MYAASPALGLGGLEELVVRGIPEGEYHHHEHYEPHDHEDGEGDRDGHGHCGHGGDAVHRADDDKVHRAYERKGSRNTEETHTSAGAVV